jgi:hypothetical protein
MKVNVPSNTARKRASLLQQVLGAPPRVHVAEAAEEDDLVSRQHRLAHRQVGEEVGSVLALHLEFARASDDVGDAGPTPRLEVAVVRRLVGLRHQDADVLSDQFLLLPAEDALDRLAGEQHATLLVDRHQRIEARAHERAQQRKLRIAIGVGLGLGRFECGIVHGDRRSAKDGRASPGGGCVGCRYPSCVGFPAAHGGENRLRSGPAHGT